MKKTILLFVSALVSSTLVWGAAPIFTLSHSPNNRPGQWPDPPEFCSTVKDYVDPGITTAYNTDGVKQIATRFTASSNYTVCRIGVKVARTNSAVNSVYISLYSHSAVGNGKPNAVLGNGIVQFNDLPQITAVSSFNYTSDTGLPQTRVSIAPVSLTSGTTYWIAVYDVQGSVFSGTYVNWYQVTTNPVTANQSYSIDAFHPATTWDDLNDTTRFKFYLYGD